MIISCPNCATRYQIGDANFPLAGRSVRCAKCHHSWHQSAPAATPAGPPPAPSQIAITCPQCAARFQADKAKFPSGGRNVRCAKCQHVWHQAAPAATPGAVADTAVAAEQISSAPAAVAQTEALAQQAIPARDENRNAAAISVATAPAAARADGFWTLQPSTLALALGSVALVGLVCAGAWFTVHRPAAPKTAPHVSLAPKPGIELRNVSYTREATDGLGLMFVINGTIANATDRELPLPPTISVGLTDADNHMLYRTEITPSVRKLAGRASVAFLTKIYNAPTQARHLTISLAGH